MRLPEQRLWDRTRTNLKPYRGIRLERYENVVAVGCPDTLAICKTTRTHKGEGIVTWIEMKAVLKPPARSGTRLIPVGKGLSQDQKNWHLDWHQHCGRSLILIGVGDDVALAVDGSLGDEVNDMSLQRVCQAAVAATWGELAFYLGWRP